VGVQRIDGDTAQSTAGVVRLIRRAAEVASARSEARVPFRLSGSLRWASIWQPTRHGPSVGCDQRRGARAGRCGSCCAAAVSGAAVDSRLHGRGSGPIAQPAGHSDALARETLLDLTADQARAMVRMWSRVVVSVARLWLVLPPAIPTTPLEPGRISDQAVRLPGGCRLWDSPCGLASA
jgi:hypothetical protein